MLQSLGAMNPLGIYHEDWRNRFHLEVPANGLLCKRDAKCQRTNVCLCARLVCVHLHLVMLKRFPFPVALTDRVDDREKEREGAGWGLLCILGGLLPIVGKLNIYIL